MTNEIMTLNANRVTRHVWVIWLLLLDERCVVLLYSSVIDKDPCYSQNTLLPHILNIMANMVAPDKPSAEPSSISGLLTLPWDVYASLLGLVLRLRSNKNSLNFQNFQGRRREKSMIVNRLDFLSSIV